MLSASLNKTFPSFKKNKENTDTALHLLLYFCL